MLLFSAVLQQGMTAMCAQTPGCPVTALHHPDDRKENLAAQVSAIETSSLTCVTVKCNVRGSTTFKKHFRSMDAREGIDARGHKTALMGNTRTSSAELSVLCGECG